MKVFKSNQRKIYLKNPFWAVVRVTKRMTRTPKGFVLFSYKDMFNEVVFYKKNEGIFGMGIFTDYNY
jgi:hypothetical protein